MGDCKSWLRTYLAEKGTTLCCLVRGDALKEGYGQRDLKQARKAIGVKTFHQFDEFGDTGNHFWCLED